MGFWTVLGHTDLLWAEEIVQFILMIKSFPKKTAAFLSVSIFSDV